MSNRFKPMISTGDGCWVNSESLTDVQVQEFLDHEEEELLEFFNDEEMEELAMMSNVLISQEGSTLDTDHNRTILFALNLAVSLQNNAVVNSINGLD